MDQSEPIRWEQLLALPLLVSGVLLLAWQFVFFKQSICFDLPFEKIASSWSSANFHRIATDPLYLRTLWLTTWISAVMAGMCVILCFPIAKTLARLQSRWATLSLSLIMLTSFITTVVQIFGLLILFRGNGLINQMLMSLSLVQQPITLIDTSASVVLGLVYASFGFSVMLMYGIVRTIPVSLEEAAAIHGASRLRVTLPVIAPEASSLARSTPSSCPLWTYRWLSFWLLQITPPFRWNFSMRWSRTSTRAAWPAPRWLPGLPCCWSWQRKDWSARKPC